MRIKSEKKALKYLRKINKDIIIKKFNGSDAKWIHENTITDDYHYFKCVTYLMNRYNYGLIGGDINVN